MNDKQNKNPKPLPRAARWILQIVVILLAYISWNTTRSGMEETVFEPRWALVASLAIQGLLFGLDWIFPISWDKLKGKGLMRVCLIVLTLIPLCYSSWFSYLYIADKIYDKSWDSYAAIKSQQNYLVLVTDALEFTEVGQEESREALTVQTAELYQLAVQMDTEEDASAPAQQEKFDAVAERAELSNYQVDAPSQQAKTQLQQITTLLSTGIDAMEKAFAPDAKSSDIEAAQNALYGTNDQDGLLDQIQAGLDQAKEDTTKKEEKQNKANVNQDDAQDVLNIALQDGTSEATIVRLRNNVNQATISYAEAQEAASEANQVQGLWEGALATARRYQTLLSTLAGGTATYQVSDSLQEIQTSLYNNVQDAKQQTEEIRARLDHIFQVLQNTADVSNPEEYLSFLQKMSSFRDDVNAYAALSASSHTLQTMQETYVREATSGKVEVEQMRDQLNELKLEISNLPHYHKYDHNKYELVQYKDKGKNVKKIDKTIMSLLTESNTVIQGLNYFYSPKLKVTIVALGLALLFDLAAFVPGFIFMYHPEDTKEAPKMLKGRSGAAPDLMNQYIWIPTKDHSVEGTQYYYTGFIGEQEVEVCAKESMEIGFYRQEANGSQTNLMTSKQQPLKIRSANMEPMDGVYSDAKFKADNERLFDAQGNLLAPLASDCLVYTYDLAAAAKDQEGAEQVQSAGSKKTIQGRKIILALDSDGKEIGTIYVLNSGTSAEQDQ